MSDGVHGLRLHAGGTAVPVGRGSGRDAARPALFVDRDGTVIEERGCRRDPADVALVPGAGAALRRVAARGLPVVVVTNQAWIARGAATEQEVAAVNRRVVELLAGEGVPVTGVYVCPHHPTDGSGPLVRACDCRKPRPGLLVQAAADHGLDLARSWVVGDTPGDVAAAAAVGAAGVLVRTGFGAAAWDERRASFTALPVQVAADLPAAIEWILGPGAATTPAARG